VYPYNKLRAPNVIGTATALKLATTGRLKSICFVSSTSVLDTDHYAHKLVLGTMVYENDDLQGSKTGLRSGYGQTKWVAEQLVLRAQARGVPATIVRPGYIVGDSHRGVTNTDDFIWRLIKGCIQLGQAPRISNIVNMCSVDYVANCVVEVVSSPKAVKLAVFHTWNSHQYFVS
jgi:L-aminoadipate-semialdehyde dehydrogenase